MSSLATHELIKFTTVHPTKKVAALCPPLSSQLIFPYRPCAMYRPWVISSHLQRMPTSVSLNLPPQLLHELPAFIFFSAYSWSIPSTQS